MSEAIDLSAEPDSAAPRSVERVIAARRTSLLVDRQLPIEPDLVDRLIEAATWAPNHKRTWPWRFTIITGDSRARLGASMAELAASLELSPSKVDKLRTKYLRSPVLVLVWQAVTENEVRAREDRDAVAAATQNLLLAATANGLASYWGTPPDDLVPAVRTVAGLDDRHDLVALVYLGWPSAVCPAPARPAPHVTRLT